MKRKELLLLMELLVMVLVFSIAAAVCLKTFSAADQKRLEAYNRDRAVLESRNAAEILQSLDGDLQGAAEVYGGKAEEGRWRIAYNADWVITDSEAAFFLTAVLCDTEEEPLGLAKITVTDTGGETIVELPTAWQWEWTETCAEWGDNG
ncbi:MAG: hypothetical protein E7638_02205 [Ruminococcaceae bacterium]|nr:hypothetical protein [Oscillospiraceae bacterium]